MIGVPARMSYSESCSASMARNSICGHVAHPNEIKQSARSRKRSSYQLHQSQTGGLALLILPVAIKAANRTNDLFPRIKHPQRGPSGMARIKRRLSSSVRFGPGGSFDSTSIMMPDWVNVPTSRGPKVVLALSVPAHGKY